MIKKSEQLTEARRIFVSARAKYAGTAQALSTETIEKILGQLQSAIDLAQNTEKTKLEAKKLYLDIIQANQTPLAKIGSQHFLTNYELVAQYANLLELGAYQKIPQVIQNGIKGKIGRAHV